MCRHGSACDIGNEVGLGEDILSTECSTDQGRVLDVRTRSPLAENERRVVVRTGDPSTSTRLLRLDASMYNKVTHYRHSRCILHSTIKIVYWMSHVTTHLALMYA